LLHPGVQFKSVEGDALFADADFSQIRPYFSVEPIAIHAEILGHVAEADQSRRDAAVLVHEGWYCLECLPGVDHSARVARKLARKLDLQLGFSTSFYEQADDKLGRDGIYGLLRELRIFGYA
jgi:hypothetical protein